MLYITTDMDAVGNFQLHYGTVPLRVPKGTVRRILRLGTLDDSADEIPKPKLWACL